MTDQEPRTLGSLHSGDRFTFYAGGVRATAHPGTPGEDEYVAVARDNEVIGRFHHTLPVYDVIPARKLR